MIQEITSSDLPGLYTAADLASLKAQKVYFRSLASYLLLLVISALVSGYFANNAIGATLSAALFLITLAILFWQKAKKPDDIWYNGRAVAESVKTRAWRFMMRAEPYVDKENPEIANKQFINDLKTILDQNRSLSEALCNCESVGSPITDRMNEIRQLPLTDRYDYYKKYRIDNQKNWYSRKAKFNRDRASNWFLVSVFLHSLAITLLLIRIAYPNTNLPIGAIAAAAGAVLTWLYAKKHKELSSSYILTAHEIALMKGEVTDLQEEKNLSDLVVNSESAFSREHTQWAARRNG